MRLSDKLRELRSQHGFSQEELARQTQLSLRTIQRIEQNETGARGDTLIRLAQVFGLKPMDLTSKTEKEENLSYSTFKFLCIKFSYFSSIGFYCALDFMVF